MKVRFKYLKRILAVLALCGGFKVYAQTKVYFHFS